MTITACRLVMGSLVYVIFDEFAINRYSKEKKNNTNIGLCFGIRTKTIGPRLLIMNSHFNILMHFNSKIWY